MASMVLRLSCALAVLLVLEPSLVEGMRLWSSPSHAAVDARGLTALKGAAPPVPDKRDESRKTVRNTKGTKISGSSKMTLVLLLLGTWDGCVQRTLTALLTSFNDQKDTVNVQQKKFATVRGWWNGVAGSLGVTAKVSFGFAKQIVEKNFKNGLATFVKDKRLTDKKSTVVVVALGQNMSNYLGATPSGPEKCARLFYQHPMFKDFMGAVLIESPKVNYQAWDTHCNWLPRGNSSTTFNRCDVADKMATHILAKLADLAANPYKYTPKSAVPHNESYGWHCNALTWGDGCTPASVCDVRRFHSLNNPIDALHFHTPKTPSRSKWLPEALAYRASTSYPDLRKKYNWVNVATNPNGTYRFFVQPYFKLGVECAWPIEY